MFSFYQHDCIGEQIVHEFLKKFTFKFLFMCFYIFVFTVFNWAQPTLVDRSTINQYNDVISTRDFCELFIICTENSSNVYNRYGNAFVPDTYKHHELFIVITFYFICNVSAHHNWLITSSTWANRWIRNYVKKTLLYSHGNGFVHWLL